MLPVLHHTAMHTLTRKNVRYESYLVRLNSDCLSKINKIDINQSTKPAIEEINHTFRLTIHKEVKYQYELLHSHKFFILMTHQNPES